MIGKGRFLCPKRLRIIMRRSGRLNWRSGGYGNPWYVPSLAELWDLQAGYRYNAETNERDDEWKDNWLVVAYDGGDPFIFDTNAEIILHDLHGQGVWDPKPIFEDLCEMISVFAVLGGISSRAGERLTDDDGVSPQCLHQASSALQTILGDQGRAMTTLERLGWQ